MLTITTILHPTDFSEHSKYALEVASALAHDLGAKLEILHVVPSRTPLQGDPMAISATDYQEELKLYQEEMKAKLHEQQAPDPFVRVKHVLKEGHVAAEIIRTAQEQSCDMVVLGTHGRSEPEKKVMGSVAEEVSRKAPCPVVTVRLPVSQAVSPESRLEKACEVR